jgi:hypothetical protein
MRRCTRRLVFSQRFSSSLVRGLVGPTTRFTSAASARRCVRRCGVFARTRRWKVLPLLFRRYCERASERVKGRFSVYSAAIASERASQREVCGIFRRYCERASERVKGRCAVYSAVIASERASESRDVCGVVAPSRRYEI